MRWSLALLLIAAAPFAARAQPAPAEPTGSFMISVNPLGFLQFGPTVEAEVSAGSVAGVAFGVRIPTFGLLAHVIDDELGFGWLGMGSVRFYFDPEAKPRGWWAAPRGEWGKTRSGGETYTVKGGGLEVGHRWISASGTALSAGAIAGAFQSDSGLEGKFIMGVLSVGLVR